MKKSLIIIFTSLLFALAFLLASNLPQDAARAGSGQNVFGWAFGENTGWLSFNRTNCDLNPQCGPAGQDYGVHIAKDGVMSGYGWSEHIGWVSFNEAELVSCPAGVCRAWVNLDTGQILGWARALSPVGSAQAGGWDGWIRLNGVSIDFATKELRGFAWGGGGASAGSALAGWISFNSLNCDSNSNGSTDNVNFSNCPVGLSAARYFVKTSFSFPPTASNLTTQAVNCCSASSQYFTWLFQDRDVGDTQSAYQLQVDKQNDFLTFGAGELDTGKIIKSGSDHASLIVKGAISGQLEYNTLYYWRVKVWDSSDTDSDWVNGATFRTPNHIYPTPNFQWLPAYPSQGETLQLCAVRTPECDSFTDDQLSKCYDNNNNLISCSGKIFLWTLPPEGQFEAGFTAASENPKIKFSNPGRKDVILKITDEVGDCSITRQIRITVPLPRWQETLPQSN